MNVVPLQSVPSQTVNVVLNNQSCTINVYAKSTGVFIDLYVNNSLIIGGVICEDRNVIVHDVYLGFVGDLAFVDTQGTSDPVYTGIGTRYQLVYYLPSDLPPGIS